MCAGAKSNFLVTRPFSAPSLGVDFGFLSEMTIRAGLQTALCGFEAQDHDVLAEPGLRSGRSEGKGARVRPWVK